MVTFALVMVGGTGCEGLVTGGVGADGMGGSSPGVGTGGAAGPGPVIVAGTGGANNGSSGGAGPVSSGGTGSGGIGMGTGGMTISSTGGAGTGGRVGTGGAAVGTGGAAVTGMGGAAGSGTVGECTPYPTAPAIVDTQFRVGTIVPNLAFTREDGTPFTFQTMRCNKKVKLIYWATGGDNCGPCIDNATKVEIPAWKELGEQGLGMIETFNGQRFLVSRTPFVAWRQDTKWPADTDTIMVGLEPTTKPYYAMGRVISAIPWMITIDAETMKVLSLDATPSVARLRTQLAAATPRQ
ncbi:MAG: hypothetical protein H7X95_00345 [Deltaproteobacteria bacterium]|nr:hypothetical protein [Deltaproteobacteria bacterium]